jgi:hypothetical protein
VAIEDLHHQPTDIAIDRIAPAHGFGVTAAVKAPASRYGAMPRAKPPTSGVQSPVLSGAQSVRGVARDFALGKNKLFHGSRQSLAFDRSSLTLAISGRRGFVTGHFEK